MQTKLYLFIPANELNKSTIVMFPFLVSLLLDRLVDDQPEDKPDKIRPDPDDSIGLVIDSEISGHVE